MSCSNRIFATCALVFAAGLPAQTTPSRPAVPEAARKTLRSLEVVKEVTALDAERAKLFSAVKKELAPRAVLNDRLPALLKQEGEISPADVKKLRDELQAAIEAIDSYYRREPAMHALLWRQIRAVEPRLFAAQHAMLLGEDPSEEASEASRQIETQLHSLATEIRDPNTPDAWKDRKRALFRTLLKMRNLRKGLHAKLSQLGPNTKADVVRILNTLQDAIFTNLNGLLDTSITLKNDRQLMATALVFLDGIDGIRQVRTALRELASAKIISDNFDGDQVPDILGAIYEKTAGEPLGTGAPMTDFEVQRAIQEYTGDGPGKAGSDDGRK